LGQLQNLCTREGKQAKLEGKWKQAAGERAVSWYVKCGEESLSSEVTALPVFAVPAVATPSHAHNVQLEELGLWEQATNQCRA